MDSKEDLRNCASTRNVDTIIHDLRNLQEKYHSQNQELQQLKSELTEARRECKYLWSEAPFGFFTHNEAGEILEANSTAKRLLRLFRESNSGKLKSELPKRDISRLNHQIRALAQNPESSKAEIRIYSSEKSPTWLMIETTCCQSNLFQSAVWDISEQKLVDEERKQIAAQLQHAQKMEVVHQMTSGIAHDFNNILQILTINAELAAIQTANDPTVSAPIQRIRETTERGTELTKRLLSFGRKTPLNINLVDLNKLTPTTIEMAERTFGEQFEFHFHPSQEPVGANVDKTQFEQVLLNLCLNARDAMPLGGKIDVRTSTVTLEQKYDCFEMTLLPGTYSVLTVTDTGEGIDPERIAEIFQPFYTTKPIGEGTGLGLAIVYGMVHQHQGAIRINTSLNEGTSFEILFPRKEISKPIASSELNAKENHSFCNMHVLLVEDETAIRDAVSMALTGRGLEICSVAGGSTALKLIRDARVPFDLLISDVVMPTVGGKTVCEAFRDKFPDAEIVLISGHGDSVLDAAFLKKNRASFLRKPFGIQQLHDCLSSATRQPKPPAVA